MSHKPFYLWIIVYFGSIAENLVSQCVIKNVTKMFCFFIITEKGFCMRGDLCPYDHGLDPVVVDDVSLGGVLAFPRGESPMQFFFRRQGTRLFENVALFASLFL